LKGVSENTSKVLQKISSYPELNDYFLVGGTALAMRLEHRLSEDLDLFHYTKFPGKKIRLPNQDKIFSRFSNDSTISSLEYYDDFDMTLRLNEVKVQLRSENQFHEPKNSTKLGYLQIPNIEDLLGMKLVALYLRNEWRDVFDIYFLSKEFSTDQFYSNYENIMSSKYCGKKSNKPNLFNVAIEKLKNEKLLKKLHSTDPMKGLITSSKINPEMVLEKFQDLQFQQKRNQGKRMSF